MPTVSIFAAERARLQRVCKKEGFLFQGKPSVTALATALGEGRGRRSGSRKWTRSTLRVPGTLHVRADDLLKLQIIAAHHQLENVGDLFRDVAAGNWSFERETIPATVSLGSVSQAGAHLRVQIGPLVVAALLTREFVEDLHQRLTGQD